ncbi:MAG: DUF2887 domain-containing protein [Waterburya sp.]
MKTDTLFYKLFQEFPWIFFQLIQREQINLNAYQFIAPETRACLRRGNLAKFARQTTLFSSRWFIYHY